MWYMRGLVILGMALTLGVASQAQMPEPPAPSAPAEGNRAETTLAAVDEVWQHVRDSFYDATLRRLDWTAIRAQYRALALAASDEEHPAVINRMLDELAASHTRYYTPADPAYYQLLDIFAGSLRRDIRRVFPDGQVTYPSIGIFTQRLEDKTFIRGLLDGFPAAKAGLLVGDELLSVDGMPYHPVQSLSTKVNQEVTLQVRRNLDGPPHDVVVVPEQIKPNEAFLKAMRESARIMHVDGIALGYIHVWSYAGQQYQRLLEHEISAGVLKEAEALVLDLRDGWGGAQAHYLDLFNAQGPMVYHGRPPWEDHRHQCEVAQASGYADQQWDPEWQRDSGLWLQKIWSGRAHWHTDRRCSAGGTSFPVERRRSPDPGCR